jgi:hypothetical protein
VSLNAGCRLPFDKRNALFKIALSYPDAPFLISAGIYGGGGYLALLPDGLQIVGFKASFEFVGLSAFSFGPLTGIGNLTTVIFVRKLYDSTTVDGFFFAGGSVRIACFGIAASLRARVTQRRGGTMAGQATSTFTFSIGLTHFDYGVSVWKTQPALGSGVELDAVPPKQYAQSSKVASDASRLETRAPKKSSQIAPHFSWFKIPCSCIQIRCSAERIPCSVA